MSMASSNVPIGTEVYTVDGDKLGTVKEVRGDYFKVDSSMHPDYWLAAECVRGGFGGSRLTVACDKDHLDDFKQEDGLSRQRPGISTTARLL